MLPISVSVGPLAAASANAIALSQSLGGAGALTLNGALVSGGVATLDKPRRVTLTSAGNDSGLTWTVTGTDRHGIAQSETLSGGNATAVTTVLDYATVTGISGSAATAGNVTVGTSSVASSQWARFDEFAPSDAIAHVIVSGTVNYTVEETLDDPNSTLNPISKSAMSWVPTGAALTAATTSQNANIAAPIFARITLNSGTGSVRATFVQNSAVPV